MGQGHASAQGPVVPEAVSLASAERPKKSVESPVSGFDPWVGKIPWRRVWEPTPVFLPGESHGQRSLAGRCQSRIPESCPRVPIVHWHWVPRVRLVPSGWHARPSLSPLSSPSTVPQLQPHQQPLHCPQSCRWPLLALCLPEGCSLLRMSLLQALLWALASQVAQSSPPAGWPWGRSLVP